MHRGRGADWQRGREVEVHWSRDVDMQRSRGAGKHMGRWQMAEGNTSNKGEAYLGLNALF